MDCSRYEEDLLIAYLFDEAAEDEKRAIEEHLSSCKRCTRTLAELRGTVTAMQTWKDEDMPRGVVLLPSRGERGRSRFKAPLWLRGFGWAAAAAAVVLVLSRGSIEYGKGSLSVTFGRGERPELSAGLEEGRSTQAPTEEALSTSDSSSSTPRRTGLLPPNYPQAAYASLSDLERAQQQNLAYVEQWIMASEQTRSEHWKQGLEYVLAAVNDQRQRDLNELMMRIDAMGAGALGQIQMTNIRLDELAGNMAPAGAGGRPQGRLTPEQIRQMQKDDEE